MSQNSLQSSIGKEKALGQDLDQKISKNEPKSDSNLENETDQDLESNTENDDYNPVPLTLENLKTNPSDNRGDQQSIPSLAQTQTNNSILTNKTLHAKKRRGILARFTIIPEFKDARDYPPKLKLLLVSVIACAAVVGPMGTSIILPAIEDIKKELNTTTMRVNVAVGVYLLSLGVFPLWWSSFSETLGRRSVYVVSFTLLIAFCIGCALAPTINSLIGFRILAGACSASVQSVGAGTIADLFKPEERGRALGLYYLGPLMAPLLSPIIGALLLIRWDWRSTQWFVVILAATIDVLLILLLPETLRQEDNKEKIRKILQDRRLHRNKFGEVETNDLESNKDSIEASNDVSNDDTVDEDINSGDEEEEQAISRIITRISTSRSQYYNDEINSHDPRLASIQQHDQRALEESIKQELFQKSTFKQRLKKDCYFYLVKPLKSVYFLSYPPVCLSISFSAISFGILYLVNMTLEYEYSRDPYNWKSLYVGFAYIPNSVSYIIASIFGGRWTDYLLKQYKAKHNGFYAPEARLSYNILSAVITFPIALMILGWCFQYHTFWVTPLVGTAIFGYASMMTIGPTVTYLVDTLPGRGSTGVALNNLVRMIMATLAVFIVEPLINAIGPGPMFSLMTGIVLVSSSVLLIIKLRGTYWRENFDLQALYDKLE
ncbi:hypothetical protein WICMUC_003406 [Wickerhamomyces mucosus]|uniref:Major facilitator superfamily (MFS) profile domain-containing protein n=1 Tax=Wickerhamomyces mucosus TaxID=1378264 RepID=A0A9P8PL13_9ASCO|nr:hypothetical protein WICMUC_003406 [Wickerhamomyces mucosus]